MLNYTAELEKSIYCLCPRGYAPWSPRMIDSLVHGCIPVLVSDGAVHPFQHYLQYDDFTIRVSEKDLHRLDTILDSISTEKQLALRSAGMDAVLHLLYSQDASASASAFLHIEEQLRQRKKEPYA